MMKYLNSPLVRMSFGLVMVTLSALLMSDMLGMVPDTRRAELNSRKIIAESLAVQFSMLIPNEQIVGIEETLKFLVNRNERVLSAAVRREKGDLFAQFGGHDQRWHGECFDLRDESRLDHRVETCCYTLWRRIKGINAERYHWIE